MVKAPCTVMEDEESINFFFTQNVVSPTVTAHVASFVVVVTLMIAPPTIMEHVENAYHSIADFSFYL